ncbi:bifunctional phosphoribosyl-AMP cyclohydrolase/phosphoribosyl-ATP diphosphatase HisIE [Aureitalea sp. L0-47]|uniref:bifunctional phosphoribosyl-AMP cyclohydrolase/phosphoribosyl-ATP diphosphatase HisIE n=1 Tax=Aureitalea sp. L0-47 TaxID=2816962 RepID=UPI0022386EFB|nr:bifunctional phosphoribosyl-AMP cyclohydrolase/phosphoribosyl-ATP diphosphatase HisIE [Aureitalea sp. L0-47]MCW5519487.1 bifunctional phosphoribosyl-AMP cyclohydrolase/phosphoribosyl-ATP diphosphatase HisIE [Aureitalea sp. L0-47]
MEIDFKKYTDGLVPVVVQDKLTRNVLMLGFMNEEAVKQTLETRKVTFFSRKKGALWMKGEESGNTLNLVSLTSDCDNDTLLAEVIPDGPVCHKGSDTCWGEKNQPKFGFLSYLEDVIEERKNHPEMEGSYVASLFRKGVNKVAQKVGEEAVELVIESKDDNDLAFLNEAADLLFHTLILLQTKGFHLRDVDKTLRSRHKFNPSSE